jgi:hypothetical protein
MEVLAMEELREPIPSSIAAVPMGEDLMEGDLMEGDPTEGMVEAMEAAGTGDKIRRCCANKRGMMQIIPRFFWRNPLSNR